MKKPYAVLVPFSETNSDPPVPEYQVESEHRTLAAAKKYQQNVGWCSPIIVKILVKYGPDGKARKA